MLVAAHVLRTPCGLPHREAPRSIGVLALCLLEDLSLAFVAMPQKGVLRKDRDTSKLFCIVLDVGPVLIHRQRLRTARNILKPHGHEIPDINAGVDAVP